MCWPYVRAQLMNNASLFSVRFQSNPRRVKNILGANKRDLLRYRELPVHMKPDVSPLPTTENEKVFR